MRYADYYDCDICNGNSVGMSLFVTGCPIHCEGCFNSDIWDFNAGKEWTEKTEEKFLNLVGRPYIKRVSFLGGSPLCKENVEDVCRIVKRIRARYPDKKIWVYTGYTFEELMRSVGLDSFDITLYNTVRKDVLNHIDVLVDGRFEKDKRDITLAFKGSTNQRVIDVQETLRTGEVVLWTGQN